MMAYDQAKKFSKRPEAFGSGVPEGIIASEASNNANVGGSLVTIMAFGIPGDAVTAVMLGALRSMGSSRAALHLAATHTRVRNLCGVPGRAPPMVMVVITGIAGALGAVTVPKSLLYRSCSSCAWSARSR